MHIYNNFEEHNCRDVYRKQRAFPSAPRRTGKMFSNKTNYTNRMSAPFPTAKRQHKSYNHNGHSAAGQTEREVREPVFCFSIRFFERTSHDQEDVAYMTRDSYGRLFKVKHIGYDPLQVSDVFRKTRKPNEFAHPTVPACLLQPASRPEPPTNHFEMDFGEHIVDLRECAGASVKTKFAEDRGRVFHFLNSCMNGPGDLVNIKRARIAILSMQMYDDVDSLVLPGEIALAEFNLHNGLVDFFECLMEPIHPLNAIQRQRLGSAAQNGLCLDRARPLPADLVLTGAQALAELAARLDPLDALLAGTARGPYAHGFHEFVRSAFPNLSPDAMRAVWETRTGQAPILFGQYARRLVLVLDHEYDHVLRGLAELARIHPQVAVDLSPDRFVLASAFFEALSDFLEVNGERDLLDELQYLGTPDADTTLLARCTRPLCGLHAPLRSACCARLAVLGVCAAVEGYFGPHLGNGLLPARPDPARARNGPMAGAERG